MAVEYTRAEVAGLETALEDWFCERKFRMDRAIAIKGILEKNNFSGLSQTSPDINAKDAILWKDLVSGRPNIDPELSIDAKLRKADTYAEMFDNATDSEHPCRGSGMTFLRCLQDNSKAVGSLCDESFKPFDQCRSDLLKTQRSVLEASLYKQDAEDRRAKALFDRRQKLLDMLAK